MQRMEQSYAGQYSYQEERQEAQNLRLLRRDLGPRLQRIETLPVMRRFLFDFKTDEERRKLAESIHRRKRLDSWTYLGSNYEYMFRKPLLSSFNEVLYEPLGLPVDIGERKFKRLLSRMDANPIDAKNNRRNLVGNYIPDFWLPFHYMGDRSIVVDLHGSRLISSNYIKKLDRARDQYGLYIVLATMSDCYEKGRHYEHGFGRKMVSSGVDELWFIDEDATGKAKLQEKLDGLAQRAQYRQTSSIESVLDKLRLKRPELNGRNCD
ncbi:MAG: hypothetical protein KGI06_02795 [Candidatus Micrarchaeota archaeon]|nr:hypothetical protein [Candidatus Micrarchaeota archaeon]